MPAREAASRGAAPLLLKVLYPHYPSFAGLFLPVQVGYGRTRIVVHILPLPAIPLLPVTLTVPAEYVSPLIGNYTVRYRPADHIPAKPVDIVIVVDVLHPPYISFI
jgi:hypothetical protein